MCESKLELAYWKTCKYTTAAETLSWNIQGLMYGCIHPRATARVRRAPCVLRAYGGGARHPTVLHSGMCNVKY